jgi:hypothetical protein
MKYYSQVSCDLDFGESGRVLHCRAVRLCCVTLLLDYVTDFRIVGVLLAVIENVTVCVSIWAKLNFLCPFSSLFVVAVMAEGGIGATRKGTLPLFSLHR